MLVRWEQISEGFGRCKSLHHPSITVTIHPLQCSCSRSPVFLAGSRSPVFLAGAFSPLSSLSPSRWATVRMHGWSLTKSRRTPGLAAKTARECAARLRSGELTNSLESSCLLLVSDARCFRFLLLQPNKQVQANLAVNVKSMIIAAL